MQLIVNRARNQGGDNGKEWGKKGKLKVIKIDIIFEENK